MKTAEYEQLASQQVEYVGRGLRYADRQRLKDGEFEGVLSDLRKRTIKGLVGVAIAQALILVVSFLVLPGDGRAMLLFQLLGAVFFLGVGFANYHQVKQAAKTLASMRGLREPESGEAA